MKKLIALVIIVVCFVGCGQTEPIIMEVQSVVEQKQWGDDFTTLLRSEDGRVGRISGAWGKPGDKISGYWTEGAFDNMLNGFRRYK
jgi:hypothetical protein